MGIDAEADSELRSVTDQAVVHILPQRPATFA